jgi:Protein of unknown function (DUF2914)
LNMRAFHITVLASLAAMLMLGTVLAQNAPASSTKMPASPASTAMPAAPAATSNAGSGPQPAATHKPPVVMRAQFTTAVNNREPVDEVTRLDNSHDQIFFFTALKDAAGQTITDRWEFNGKTIAEVSLQPKADRWRTWSSKKLMPDQTGTWTVKVVDDSGQVLMSKSFDYTQAPKTEAKTASTAAMQSTAAPASTHAATPPPR